MKPALIIGSLVLLTAVILSQNACNNEMAAMSSSLPDPVLIQTQGPKNFDVKLESQSSVSLNLADERKFKVKATAQTAFAGSFKITLDRAGLATLDPSNDVVITPAEVSLDLASGESQEFEVTVKTSSMARSGAGRFSLIAKPDPATSNIVGQAKLDFDLGVNALYEILIMGRVNGQMVYNRGITLQQFRAHNGGLTVRYLNADRAEEHTIHGSGTVTHQNAGNPLDRAGVNGPIAAGVYEIKVMPSGNATNGAYHCHIHGGADHLMRFNVP